MLRSSLLVYLFTTHEIHNLHKEVLSLKARIELIAHSILEEDQTLLFNKSPKILTHKCGSSQRHEMVEGLTKVETNPGCQVFTENFTNLLKTDVSMDSKIINLPRKINFTFHEMELIILPKLTRNYRN